LRLIMSTMGVATRKRSRGVDESDDAGTKLMPLEEAVPPLHAMRQTSRTRRATGGGEASPGGKGDESDYDEAGEADDKKKKYCFVWTAQLHQRFEAAVRKLGVSHAKPQAIRQLMGCDGEAALPTRQNIKSHLQKYRLLVQKQAVAAQQASSSARPESRMPASFPFAQMHVEGASDCQPTTHESKISPMMQRQQIGLLAQLDVHTRLASQLILQRRTQHAIAQRINASGKPALSREQLQRCVTPRPARRRARATAHTQYNIHTTFHSAPFWPHLAAPGRTWPQPTTHDHTRPHDHTHTTTHTDHT